MDELFNAMGEMYGNKFTSEWGAFDATGAWWAELQHVTPGQLAIGLRRVRQQIQDAARQNDEAWPPTPLAFAAMCQPKPEDMGLPSEGEAWREVVANAHQPARHSWSHEAVRMAGAAVGWWDLTHGTSDTHTSNMERTFRTEYAALVNRVMAGEQLQARTLIGHDSQKNRAELAERASREAAQRQAEAAGMPPRMNSEQGLRSLRAALGGC
ncbi:replication protein P [Vreelandella venusta]|uniref:replication protein P n=1 Tax=Vreelandella venusta TaxID=44935 RepID=UPI00200E1935|nr:replication protein P [Halomonas venusta]UQI41902.1 replication protein P [Halomonas venusta]